MAREELPLGCDVDGGRRFSEVIENLAGPSRFSGESPR